jgi:hypothetical protein
LAQQANSKRSAVQSLKGMLQLVQFSITLEGNGAPNGWICFTEFVFPFTDRAFIFLPHLNVKNIVRLFIESIKQHTHLPLYARSEVLNLFLIHRYHA